ncbi:hypothetical protein [Mycobacteroides abscessus]|uniref:HNH endonuclease n=1 Tax=Mycobacteroides abscessus subsp. abscessus TaxID=1185650 RepID=A0AB38CWU8_9MYCO|nr:hypothetical protein [Mycobacteroides abscessus]MDB2193342.1 HNH endonuclease [Mycobacteroides abscessus subsp. abscessus]MDB2198517.1 HNH endonuclease [Mycobacteroides abscessus subsp. abscessus]SHP77845.1 Uncharacterised protein [Mycobacteroides abscessus subsp. abscessus]SHU40586.1 Uncharacterised protein [Mycobacteroides abscessus subsp. abscessus]SHX07697.1 Uncharacterised protein [Mycobacteroides abscessus subsp. abscessus]
MTEPRVNDTRAKRLRARLRGEQRPCHICGGDIDYGAHHHSPHAFQLDHLWQVALGGPEYEYSNAGASHRACNRQRSDKVDHITIAAAARHGVTIEPDERARRRRGPQPTERTCGTPDGQHCTGCNGTHTGSTFVTARNWWS